jgi:hypothetical protein
MRPLYRAKPGEKNLESKAEEGKSRKLASYIYKSGLKGKQGKCRAVQQFHRFQQFEMF